MKILFFAFVIIFAACIGEVSSTDSTDRNNNRYRDIEMGENSRLLPFEEKKPDYTQLNVDQIPVVDLENDNQFFSTENTDLVGYPGSSILVIQVNNASQPPSNGVNNNLLRNNFSYRFRGINNLFTTSIMFLPVFLAALIAIQDCSTNYPSPAIYCNKNWNNLTHINDLNLTHVKWPNSLVDENCIIQDCLKEMYSEGKENYSYKECLHQSCLDFKAKCDQGIKAESNILLDIAALSGYSALFIFAQLYT